jgi:glycogen synthase
LRCRALAHFKDQRSSWTELSATNMNTELSWSRSSADYVALYNSIAMP